MAVGQDDLAVFLFQHANLPGGKQRSNDVRAKPRFVFLLGSDSGCRFLRGQ